jgi:hypothetical protein
MADAVLPHTIRTGDQRSATKVQANDEALRDAMNALTDENVATAGFSSAAFSDALAVLLGLTKSTTVRRGKSVIATEESRTNTAYGLLSTPDRVSGVTLPTDGLLFIAFQGMWKESVGSAARAAIFLGSNQLQYANDRTNAAPVVSETALIGTANTYKPISSYPGGVYGVSGDATAYTGDVTTGQVVGVAINSGWTGNNATSATGGICVVRAAAGSYDVSVQFKASSGSVTAKNRSLHVWTQGF